MTIIASLLDLALSCRSRLLAVILLVCPAAAVSAAEIYLKDGSVIVGTIESLVDGKDLTLDTAHMDTVVIDWESIERIEGSAQVNVKLFSGERLAGNLSLGDDRLYVGTPDTQSKQEIEPEQVFEISQYTDRWVNGLDAELNIGFNLVRGNNRVTQVSYGGGLSYDGNRFESGFDTSLIINEQNESENTRRFSLRSRYNYELAERWSAGGIYQFESDDRQQLSGRSLLAAQLSNRFINDHNQQLRLSGGLALNAENFETAQSSETLEAIVGTVYRLRSRLGIDLDATFYGLKSLSDSDRVRAQFDATLSADLFGDLDARLVYYNRYDSEPPVAVSEFDYGLTLAFGYSF